MVVLRQAERELGRAGICEMLEHGLLYRRQYPLYKLGLELRLVMFEVSCILLQLILVDLLDITASRVVTLLVWSGCSLNILLILRLLASNEL